MKFVAAVMAMAIAIPAFAAPVSYPVRSWNETKRSENLTVTGARFAHLDRRFDDAVNVTELIERAANITGASQLFERSNLTDSHTAPEAAVDEVVKRSLNITGVEIKVQRSNLTESAWGEA